jgi:large subunit ribosomal protein L20
MARVKRGTKRRERHNKILKAAAGFRERRRTAYRRAVETVHKGWAYAYAHRKQNKRNFRALWIVRINAACRANGVKYSQLIKALADKGSTLDRKVLADVAVHDPEGFTRIVKAAGVAAA